MRFLPLLLLALSAPLAAAPVYKCKGAKGETIYQNLPCPAGAKTLATGAYAPVPDDPSQMRAAHAEAQRIRQEREDAAYAAQASAGYEQTGVAPSNEPTVDPRKVEKWKEDRARWGSRLAGPPPPGAVEPRRAAPAPTFAEAPPAQKPPAYTTGCKQNGTSITCTDSNGGFSHGSVNPYGSGSVSNADGSITTIRRDPAGHLKTQDGTCVKDIYGQCQ